MFKSKIKETMKDQNKTFNTRTSRQRDVTFFQLFRPVVMTAQFLALMPVQGIMGQDYTSVKFKKLSWQFGYCLLFLVGALLNSLVSIGKFVKYGIKYSTFTAVFFFSIIIGTCFNMLKLSVKWREICQSWHYIDGRMNCYDSLHKYVKLFKLFITVYFMLCLAENVSARSQEIYFLHCSNQEMSYFKIMKTFTHVEQIFEYVPYSTTLGTIMFFYQLLFNLSWNFPSLFLSLLGLCLSIRFGQISRKVRQRLIQGDPVLYWRKIREDFAHLAELTRQVDEHVGFLIMVTFANNVSYICIQLIQGFNSDINIILTFYFYFSFGFLVARASMICLCVATVNDQSKQIVQHLFLVPSQFYNEELSRFIHHATTDNISLTGCRFFAVTRSLLLTIAGTIITYEIVLYQFTPENKEQKDNSSMTMCQYLLQKNERMLSN